MDYHWVQIEITCVASRICEQAIFDGGAIISCGCEQLHTKTKHSCEVPPATLATQD